jgi:predicted NUDIX family phosphoesterase
MAQEEQVLVVERRVIEQAGMFQGLTFDVERYLSCIFAPGVPRFMPRSKAETDPTYKQLIPYVIVAAGGKYLSYVRGKQAGEKRLVGNRSIGIGGHINPADDMPLFSGDFRETYRAAVEREVAEEVSLDGPHTDRVVALLNDDSTEVGRVHLGVVHYWSLATPTVRKREQMMTQLDFLGTDELQQARDEMETWSQFCFDHLSEMDRRGVSDLTPSDSTVNAL